MILMDNRCDFNIMQATMSVIIHLKNIDLFSVMGRRLQFA